MNKLTLVLALLLALIAPAKGVTIPLVVISSSINLSVIASRTESCVAPCAFVLDATGTQAPATTDYPFHELQYSATFDDAGSGTWATGSRAGVSSKNTATGGVTAHVYETAGTYAPCLSVTDGTNTAQQCLSVTVVAANSHAGFAGSGTACITDTGSDYTGCPDAGATHISNSNFSSALAAAFSASAKRILFRRGGTWTTTANGLITAAGPGLIGAYGSGAKPIVTTTSDIDVLAFSGASNSDWRVIDLDLRCTLNTSSCVGINSYTPNSYTTVLRVDMDGFSRSILWSAEVMSGAMSYTTVQQVTVTNTIGRPYQGGGYGFYIESNYLALLGNSVDVNGGGEHTIRLPYVNRGAIANNYLARPATTKNVLTIRGAYMDTVPYPIQGQPTQFVNVSDNSLLGADNTEGGNAIMANVGPQDGTYRYVIRDLVWERNYVKFNGGTTYGTQTGLQVVSTTRNTARNNIFNMDGGKAHTAIELRGSALNPLSNTWLYNNTAYTNDSGNSAYVFYQIGTSAVISGTVIKNNLGYTPNDSTKILIYDENSAGFTASGNTCDTANCTARMATDPLFAGPMTTPAGYTPGALSYAIGGGVSVPVWSDFFLAAQPGTRNIGAVNR